MQNVFGRFSRLALLSPLPTPSQFIKLTCFTDLCSSGPVSQTQKGVRGEIEYDAPNLSEICDKYIKRYEELSSIIDVHIQPVLSKNHTCVFPESNF
jgi:hypothetical protein